MSRTLTLLSVLLTLSGCAVGYNSTLFYTQSNIGLDAETKPPTAEISIARREGVIEPGFEGGQTPPVIAGFKATPARFRVFLLRCAIHVCGWRRGRGTFPGAGGSKCQPGFRPLSEYCARTAMVELSVNP